MIILANRVERLWNLSGVFSADKYVLNKSFIKFERDFNYYEFAAVKISSPQSVPLTWNHYSASIGYYMAITVGA